MEFHRGKAFPTSEQDRYYVRSENYVYDFFENGKTRCPNCKSESVNRTDKLNRDTSGHLKIETKCLSCAYEWNEVYALIGCTDFVWKSPNKP